MKEVEPVPIAGNRLVWLHIQKENALYAKIPKINKELNVEELKITLDPLGYDPIIDIDEIHSRNRRKTDDPYIKATSAKMKHRFPKIDNAERR